MAIFIVKNHCIIIGRIRHQKRISVYIWFFLYKADFWTLNIIVNGQMLHMQLSTILRYCLCFLRRTTNSPCTVDTRGTIQLYVTYRNVEGETSGRFGTHERQLIPPHGRAMGCLSWVVWKISTARVHCKTILYNSLLHSRRQQQRWGSWIMWRVEFMVDGAGKSIFCRYVHSALGLEGANLIVNVLY